MDKQTMAALKAMFDRLGSIAEIAAMPEPQRTQYEQSLKLYRDNLSILRTERAEGRAEGRLAERYQIAKNLKEIGMDCESISRATGLSLQQISNL